MTLWDKMCLKSKNPQTRQEAAERLVASAKPEAIELLVGCLYDQDAMVRRSAARAFNTISYERAISALIAALKDTHFEVRAAAASALGRQGDISSIKPLVQVLRDPKSRVRTCAASSLRKLGWKPSDNEEHALFEIALGNPRNAVQAGTSAIELLAAELSHETSFHRRAVAEALRDMNHPEAIKSLLNAAKFDADVTVRVAAIYALTEVEDAQVIPALEKSLGAGDARVRLAAAQVLAVRADPSQAHRFLELLKDKHFEIRLAAVKFLSKLRGPEITSALMPMIHDPDKDVREAVAKAMGAMRSTAATESLVLALIDEDHSVRLAAESALEQIDPHWILSEAARHAMARLELSANDNRGWVRAATVMLLEKLGATNRGMRAHA